MPNLNIRIAQDRASTRSFDQDGHLHVADNILTVAGTSQYYGSEIPNAEALGLDSNRIYTLLRPASELKRAVSSLTGKPILARHTPISASDHPHDDVIGAVGDCAFDGKSVRGSLTFWTKDAISQIKSGEMRDLSCGYWFAADMTPGMFNGTRYQGVMRDIRFNHLATVVDGRVEGAMVGDSAPPHFRRNIPPMDYDRFSPSGIIRAMNAIGAARDAVRPYVGELSMSFDSADGVYLAALRHLGHDVAAIAGTPEAAPALWISLRSQRPRRTPATMAADARVTASMAQRFPGTLKLKVR